MLTKVTSIFGAKVACTFPVSNPATPRRRYG